MLAESWRLHYRSPAAKWEAHGLPIGNGRLGAVLRGEIARDVVQFNENSLWAGSNNYANGLCGVADDVFDTSMHGFGRYLDFGRVTISFADLDESTVSGYERALDLRHAVAYACFDAGGVRHQRSAFASREADVIVLRYSASAPFGCTVRLESAQGVPSRVAGDTSVVFDGVLGNGLRYCASLVLLECDGRSIAHGDRIVVEDATTLALVLDASVGDNLGFATLYPTAKAGLADRSGQHRRATEVAEKLRIRMADLSQPIRNLSGGNQQKAVFGRWVLAGSKVLLLDEPTRGVDVGAKVEIYNIINEVTAAGGAVLMASSDLPEVLGMSDRILVMSGGQLAGQLPKNSTQDEVMAFAVSNVTSATSAAAAAPAGTDPKDEA